MDSADFFETLEPWNGECEPLFLAVEAAVEAGDLTPWASVNLGFEGTSWNDDGSDLPSLLTAARARVKHGPALTAELQTMQELDTPTGVRISIRARQQSIWLAGHGTDALRTKRAYEATRAVLIEQALVASEPEEPEETDPVPAAPAPNDPEPIPDSSARIHHAEHRIERWGGTLSDVAVLFQLAASEIIKRSDDEPTPNIRINYVDGHEPFTHLARFVQADIDISKVRSIDFNMHAHNASGDWVSVSFGQYFDGLHIDAYSSDRVWALGLADLLRELTQFGALPEKTGERRPLKWWEWALVAAAVVAGGIDIALVILSKLDLFYGVYLAFLIGFIFNLPLIDAWDRGIKNPRFKLLPEGTTSDAIARKPGWPVRVQEWIRKRPILSVTLAFLSSIAANLVSELL